MLALIACHILKRNTVRGINTWNRLLSGSVCVGVRGICMCLYGWVPICLWLYVHTYVHGVARSQHQVSSTVPLYLFLWDGVLLWIWSSLLQLAWLAMHFRDLSLPLDAWVIRPGIQIQVPMLWWQPLYGLSHLSSSKPIFSCHLYYFVQLED